jgi:small-conductance mechanosensitive channel
MDLVDTDYIYNKFNSVKNSFIDILPLLLSSIFIFIIFYVIARYYEHSIDKPKVNQEAINNADNINDNLIYNQLNKMIYYSIIIFGLVLSLVNLGFNVATIIALLGSIGLAFGLAFQDTLKNMISGIYIALNELFAIGDIVSIKPFTNTNNSNNNATFGKIVDFNLNYTTIMDLDNHTSIIPNSVIQNNILTYIKKQSV